MFKGSPVSSDVIDHKDAVPTTKDKQTKSVNNTLAEAINKMFYQFIESK